ncbi:MAG TPA: Crp/Fnr family transcriptional regulator [Gemmataceae bacterium]|nr:Crp/Fnr family transcriptional regulator [Gemmataceae bacterium]
MARGQEAHWQDEAGSSHYVYFPTGGMISLTVPMEDGKVVETATVGNEGMVGLPAVLGLDFSPNRAVSQLPSQGLRIPVASFLKVMKPGGALDRLVRRYAAYCLRYAYQTIACNLLHSVEERMCRWLLMSHDRAATNEFALTHEFLAEMLGARRQTITVAAGTLQRAGILAYRRGLIRVLDREKLENASCECYALIKIFYDRLIA